LSIDFWLLTNCASCSTTTPFQVRGHAGVHLISLTCIQWWREHWRNCESDGNGTSSYQ